MPAILQRKLIVGEVDDPLEHEADRVADQVMRFPDRALSIGPAPLQVSRKCAACEEDEQLRRKRSDAAETAAAAAPALVHEVLRAPGQTLDAATRAYFEPRFRQDFSRVQVHAGPQAAAAAKSVQARAFTVGHHVVFGAGHFAPGSNDGRKLLAHELTHVVQQARSAAPVVRRDNKDAPSPPTMSAPTSAAQPIPADAIRVIQVRWSKAKGAVEKFTLLKPWISKGDAVIALMLDHETGYFRAIEAGDADLAASYKLILDSDLAAYRYISWHAVVYLNWLSLSERFDSLVRSFDKDKRDFAGRHDAEEKARAIKDLIDSVGNQSTNTLRDLVVDHPYHYRAGRANEVIITITSAVDKGKRAALEQETAKLTKTDLTVGASIQDINHFLDNATKEGFWQAVDAVKEYYEIRQGIIDDESGPDADDKGQTGSGSSSGAGSGSEPEKEKKPKKEKKEKEPGEPCDLPLPIKWPRNLPLPGADRRPLERTPSGDWNLAPDKRSGPQGDLQTAIKKAREKNVPPPRPCFADAEPNTIFEAHHMQPLFLGGAEDEVNLCSLFIDYHRIGHRQLLDQSSMLNSDPVWKACKITTGNLLQHPGSQEYKISGRK